MGSRLHRLRLDVAFERVVKDFYLSSLLERLLVDCHQQNRMRTRAILCASLHIFDQVFASGKVHEMICAKLLCHLLLLISAIDGYDPQSHGFGKLTSQRAKTAASADDGDILARTGTRLLETFIDGDARAKHRSDSVQRNVFWDAGDVGSFADSVLLERAINCIA